MRRGRRRFYDLFSPFYDAFVRLHSGDTGQRLRRLLVERCGVRPGERVLDLCTGTGEQALHFARAGARVVGLDFSRGMLRRALAKARSRGLRLELVEADASRLPFREGSFDLVVCAYAFYELRGELRERALAEMARVLRPGGRAVLVEHEPPRNPLTRALFYLRIYAAGAREARAFLREDVAIVGRHFARAARESLSTGRTKLIWGWR